MMLMVIKCTNGDTIGFYCTPLLQRIYIGVTCLIFVIGVFVSIFGSKNSPNSALIRQGGFAALTVFGFVPLFRKSQHISNVMQCLTFSTNYSQTGWLLPLLSTVEK